MTVDVAIDIERIEGDKEYRDELRYRCQTDPFFLAPFLGYNDFIPEIHAPVADLYVKKRPGLSIADQDPIKYRMHLDPRHTFKTTYGILDTIQWILVDPDVTIVNETATRELGTLLTKRIARAFFKPKTRAATPFQRLFPEYVVEKNNATYRAPCSRRDEIEPTLYSTSVGSAQSGYHPWIINPDDMVDMINSGMDATDDSRERVWNTYQTNKNTLRHGGYIHIRGTRYHPFDLYGRLLKVIDPSEWKMLIRKSLIVKSGKRLVEGEFPGPEEVELQFEKLLSYNRLKSLFREDYASYMSQQMNDPDGGGVSLFPADRFAQAQLAPERIPSLGEVRICWRLPTSAKPYMERYAEGAAVMYLGARVYVIDAWRGVYTPSELVERIVRSCRQHQTGDLIIEQTPGSESLIPHIQNEAVRKNVSLSIDRPEFQSDDAIREGRMRQLEPMLQSGRLWFAKDMVQFEEMQTQFVHFGRIEQNGFVDTVSRLALRVPVSILANEITAQQREMHQMARERSIYDMIYGDGGAVAVEQSVLQEAMQRRVPSNSYGLRPLLGGLDG